MNLLQATNTPEPLALGGETYPARTLTFGEWAAFQSWLASKLPAPMTRAAVSLQQLRDSGQKIDLATEELILDHALREQLHWPPRLGSRAWLDAVDSAEGGLAELVLTILSRTVPGFDRPKAADLAAKMSTEDAEGLLDL